MSGLKLPQQYRPEGVGLISAQASPSDYLLRFAAAFCQRLIDPAAPERPDYLFSDKATDAVAAAALDCQFIPVDIDGEIPASGSANNSAGAKSSAAAANSTSSPVKICIFGPESTGKSTLAKKLTSHFGGEDHGTALVPEFAKGFLSYRLSPLSATDFDLIARGQTINQAIVQSGEAALTICDSDLLTTFIYADVLFGSCPTWIKAVADDETKAFDLYLLTGVDVPWVDDKHRVLPEERQQFFDRCERELIARRRPYVLIKGDWEKRFADSVAAVSDVLTRSRQK